MRPAGLDVNIAGPIMFYCCCSVLVFQVLCCEVFVGESVLFAMTEKDVVLKCFYLKLSAVCGLAV